MGIRLPAVAAVLLAFVAMGLVILYNRDGKPMPEEASLANPGGDVARTSHETESESVVNERLALISESSDENRWRTASSEEAAHWISMMTSGDASKRADAIVALARAPKSVAVPVLRNVVRSGETHERALALQSLRDLALYQGDDDGAIRGVVREAIYHGDEAGLVESAQVVLEIIEESEME